MREILIRGIDFTSREELHACLAESLAFPDYYGANLDALYDVLTDISEDTVIQLDLSDMEDDGMMDYLLRVREVMEDASEENPRLSVYTA